LKVVIDTNVLSQDPFFRRPSMEILIKIAKNGQVELVIPEMVFEEFRTQQLEEIRNEFSGAIAKTKSKISKTKDATESGYLIESETNLQKALRGLEEGFNSRFDNFLTETNAEIIEPSLENFQDTFKYYFEGKKPFKSLKSRADIPDAVIYFQILDIPRWAKPTFVCNDGTLREAVSEAGVEVFSSLDDFIKSEKLQEIVNKADDIELFKKVHDYISLHLDELKPKIIEKTSKLLELEMDGADIYDGRLHDDNHEAKVESFGSFEPLEIDWENSVNYSSNLFEFDFTSESECELEYFIFKADYYALDHDEMGSIIMEDWNDHYFRVTDPRTIKIEGRIAVKFNFENLNENNIPTAIRDFDVQINDLELAIKDETS